MRKTDDGWDLETVSFAKGYAEAAYRFRPKGFWRGVRLWLRWKLT